MLPASPTGGVPRGEGAHRDLCRNREASALSVQTESGVRLAPPPGASGITGRRLWGRAVGARADAAQSPRARTSQAKRLLTMLSS